MKIAILGWGSLIWDPRDLPIRDGWKKDGPPLPIEFCRISGSWPLTLVIQPGVDGVNVLHTLSDDMDVIEARNNLAAREGCGTLHIGLIDSITEETNISSENVQLLPVLEGWMASHGYDSVIWTDLPSNFKEKTGNDFNIDNGIGYLRSLSPEGLARALHYIDKAPLQVKTRLRVAIESELR